MINHSVVSLYFKEDNTVTPHDGSVT